MTNAQSNYQRYEAVEVRNEFINWKSGHNIYIIYMKLREYIQTNLWISRRRIMDHLKSNNIYINNQLVENFGLEIDNGDILTIKTTDIKDHKVKQCLWSNSSENTRLIAWHKPAGYAVSKSDPHNDTIYQILPLEFAKFYYVGRLDKDSTGLLLLTNSGELANKLSHPSNNKLKTYLVWVKRQPTDQIINDMIAWNYVDIDGEEVFLRFSRCEIIWPTTLKITLEEGKNRHIRRLLAYHRQHCERIHRVGFDEYILWDLWPNQRREEEI